MKEIVARIPQVSDQYNAWTEKPLPFVVLYQLCRETTQDGIYKFSVAKVGFGRH